MRAGLIAAVREAMDRRNATLTMVARSCLSRSTRHSREQLEVVLFEGLARSDQARRSLIVAPRWQHGDVGRVENLPDPIIETHREVATGMFRLVRHNDAHSPAVASFLDPRTDRKALADRGARRHAITSLITGHEATVAWQWNRCQALSVATGRSNQLATTGG
ncbi:MAG: hypothetical protein ACRDS9_07875 [Pseudonocardiaceae bacterium]